jgi:peroxiredoxin
MRLHTAGVAAAASLQIGQPAPEFTAKDSRGSSIALSQYRGCAVKY